MLPVTMVMIVDLLLLCLFRSLAAFFDDLDVVVEDCCDDGDHVSFNNAGSHALGATNTYVNDTLKREIPLPHAHHVSAAALLENADQPLNSAIDCEDVADASG